MKKEDGSFGDVSQAWARLFVLPGPSRPGVLLLCGTLLGAGDLYVVFWGAPSLLGEKMRTKIGNNLQLALESDGFVNGFFFVARGKFLAIQKIKRRVYFSDGKKVNLQGPKRDDFFQKKRMNHRKKKLSFHYTDCLIEILIMVYYRL